MLWPEVLREFAWSQHRRRRVRVLAWVLVVNGLFCWAAHDYCLIEIVAARFSLFLIASGSLLILVPSVGLRSLQAVVLARAGRIRMMGLALVLLSGFLLVAACPDRLFYSSNGLLAALLSSMWHV